MEQGEVNRQLDIYIEVLEKKANEFRSAIEYCDRQVKLLYSQKELLQTYGAQMPIAMQAAQLIIEEISAATGIKIEDLGETTDTPPVSIGGRIKTLRPRPRRIHQGSSKEEEASKSGTNYNIAPMAKPIMNGIFGNGKDSVPQNLDSLFERIYGKDWRLRQLLVPEGPSKKHRSTTYGDDLLSNNSFLKRLVRGADEVINTKMRGSGNPNYEVAGKVAAPELVQLYNIIDTIGWDTYDNFMVRNGIRKT